MTVTAKDLVPAPKARVLVVDDYPDSAEISSVLLTLYGHECRIAFTGHSALEKASEFDPEIVILDIGLPDISGMRSRARCGPAPVDARCTSRR